MTWWDWAKAYGNELMILPMAAIVYWIFRKRND